MRTSTLVTALSALPAALSKKLPEFTNSTATPRHFGVLIYPGYQILDAFGAIDVFNTLIDEYSLHNYATFSVIAESKAPVSTVLNTTVRSFGQSVVVTHTYEEILSQNKPLDVLLVPGGGGTRAATIAGAPFIKAVYPRLQHLLSVCSGATIVSATGLLDGRNATTSKANFDRLITRRPAVNWQRPARWVQDGNIWSGSGGGSSSDLAFAWIASTYGTAVADYLGWLIEYTRAGGSKDDPYSDYWIKANAEA